MIAIETNAGLRTALGTVHQVFEMIHAGVYGAETAGRLADALRLRGLDYHQVAAIAARHDIDGATWEALLYEADS